jgi:transcriptional regulator with XRE-family HTH domain
MSTAGSSKLDNLRAERIAAGHSVARLAKMANVSDQTITQLENGGSSDDDAVQRIADALGVSLETLGQRVM